MCENSVPDNKRLRLLTALRKYEDNLELQRLECTIEINRSQDELWKAIIQSWGMMDFFYR